MAKVEEQAIQEIKSTRRSARVANIQAELVASKEIRSSTERRTDPASYESIPDRALIKDEVPQKKSTQQEKKLFVNSINQAGPSIPINTKDISSNLITDTPIIQPGTRTGANIREHSMATKVSAEDCISKRLTDFHPA